MEFPGLAIAHLAADANKLNAGAWMSAALNVDLEKTSEVKLVGVLAGDVDGSWAG